MSVSQRHCHFEGITMMPCFGHSELHNKSESHCLQTKNSMQWLCTEVDLSHRVHNFSYTYIYIYLYIYMYVYVYTYVYMVQSSLFLHVIFSHSTPILPLSLLPAWHAGHRQKGGDDGGEGACGAVHHAGPRRGGSHGPWRLPKSSILGYHHFCKPPSII